MCLCLLPSDILLLVMSFLPATGLLRVARTNWKFYSMYRTYGLRLQKFQRSLWFHLSDEFYIGFNCGVLEVAPMISAIDSSLVVPFLGRSCIQHMKEEERTVILPSASIVEFGSLQRELFQLFRHILSHYSLKEVLTNLPLNLLLEVVQLWNLEFVIFDYANILSRTNEDVFISVLQHMVNVDEIGILHTSSRVSKNFFLHPRIRDLCAICGPLNVKATEDVVKFAKELDDEILLSWPIPYLTLKQSRTNVTSRGLNAVIRQWADGRRRIRYFAVRVSGEDAFWTRNDVLKNLPEVETIMELDASTGELVVSGLRRYDGECLRVWLHIETNTMMLKLVKNPPDKE